MSSVNRQLWELFNDVLDADPSARAVLIDTRCGGDTELRSSLEQLLELHSVAYPALDRPSHLIDAAGTGTAETLAESERAASSDVDETQIGPYAVVERIGTGGMGVVYLAEQSTPIRRQVALKVIKRGMDSQEVVARFEAERQALAVMNHPSIARIFDAGVTERGSPFFAMEYVPGLPIREYCDRDQLSIEARIELFLSVCEAVQHAHQKGIIHRDIKPSNVLVSTVDGKALPKVIDFGVAKAVRQPLGDESIHTLQGMVIGTPEYMSPEQACGGEDVDTRADVYALGVLLYELLAGTLPFSSEELRRGGYAEMQRIIAEDVPPRPSTRAPTPWARRVHGDLDWIVLKAIEKERDQRYPSPASLANDLVRHLRHEPVTAGAPSLWYQARKLVLRNRAATLAVGTVFAALLIGVATNQGDPTKALLFVVPILLAGFAIAVALLLRTRRAQKGEATQRSLAQKQREIAETQKQEAEKSERVAAEHLAEVLRLSDRHRLGELIAQERQLWPARPQRQGDLEAWLEQARTLASRAADHERTLLDLRATATSTEQDEDGNAVAWQFATAEQQWRHDLLTELVSGLAAFIDQQTGNVASVEARLRTAETIEEQTVHSAEARSAWQAAIADIAALPDYEGLQLTPQVGLLPLRRDPASGLWEFWQVETGDRPEPNEDDDAPSPWRITETSGVVLTLIPGGTFHMGAQAEDPAGQNYDPDADEKEGPVEAVTLAPFFIGRYQITQGQWLRITGSSPSVYGPDREYGGKQHDLRHPVENVSWEECETTLGRVVLELPSEAQWEYAARGKTTTPWHSGSDKTSLQGYANLSDAFAQEHGAPKAWDSEGWLSDGYVLHAPVGTYLPNAFGLHDAHGNVWEWCWDWFEDDASTQRRAGDGRSIVKVGRSRIFRGGSFMHLANQARSSNRIMNAPHYRGSAVGIRSMRRVQR